MPDPEFISVKDINHDAVVARGGDRYGDYQLFKCPQCGHPMLLDFEHDYFYADILHLDRRGSFERASCLKCSLAFAADDLWELGRAGWFYPKWLLTPADAQLPGIREILRPVTKE